MSTEQRQSGRGVFRYYSPPWPLSRFVESLYSTQVSEEFAAGIERAERLPEVSAQLVFLLAEGRAYPSPRRVSGELHASLFLQPGHLVRIDIPLSVREVTAAALRPSGLGLVLPHAAPSWSGQRLIALEDILGQPARDLLERLLAEPSREARLGVMRCFLESRMRRVAPPSRLVVEALRVTMRSRGSLSVARIAEQCGCSVRRLHQVAVQTTGLSPKDLARIARAQHLLEVLMSESKLTDAAMSAGFFDHPHLIHECQALFGCTPGELAETLRKTPALDPIMSTNRQLISTGLALVPRAPPLSLARRDCEPTRLRSSIPHPGR